jgi:hypothetical protein
VLRARTAGSVINGAAWPRVQTKGVAGRSARLNKRAICRFGFHESKHFATMA